MATVRNVKVMYGKFNKESVTVEMMHRTVLLNSHRHHHQHSSY